MRRPTFLLGPVAVFIVFVGQGSVLSASGAGPDPTHRPNVEDHSELTAEQLEFVAWGESRFLDAGLVPPQVRFVFHHDTTECRLRRGLYYHSTRTVEICNVNPETLIHEMAHAWVEANLTSTAKRGFMAHRGLSVWADRSVPWIQRANEHAAEIIAWGVEEESRLVTWVQSDGSRIHKLLSIPDSTPTELAVAYELLTGTPADIEQTTPDPGVNLATSPEANRAPG